MLIAWIKRMKQFEMDCNLQRRSNGNSSFWVFGSPNEVLILVHWTSTTKGIKLSINNPAKEIAKEEVGKTRSGSLLVKQNARCSKASKFRCEFGPWSSKGMYGELNEELNYFKQKWPSSWPEWACGQD